MDLHSDSAFTPADSRKMVDFNIKLPEDAKIPQMTEKPIKEMSTPFLEVASTGPLEAAPQYPENEELEPEYLELEPEEYDLFTPTQDESDWNTIMTDKPMIPMVTKKPVSIVRRSQSSPVPQAPKPCTGTELSVLNIFSLSVLFSPQSLQSLK